MNKAERQSRYETNWQTLALERLARIKTLEQQAMDSMMLRKERREEIWRLRNILEQIAYSDFSADIARQKAREGLK